MKKLTLDDVVVTIDYEQEDTPVKGNAMCSDDEVFNKEVEDQILSRLANNDTLAWCCLKASVTPKHLLLKRFKGEAYLGGCSFDWKTTQAELEKEADSFGMANEALEYLNKELQDYLNEAAEIRAYLE